MLKDFGVYVTIITAIVVAYLTYRNQLKLKAFELFLGRRQGVLTDIEKQLQKLQQIANELDEHKNGPMLRSYLKDFFHDSIIISSKVRSANLGENAEAFVDAYSSVAQEPLSGKKEMDLKDWIHRTVNLLSALYAAANVTVNSEIEKLSLPFTTKIMRKCLTIAKKWKQKKGAKTPAS